MDSFSFPQRPSPPLLLRVVLLVAGDSNLALQPNLVRLVQLRLLEILLR
jgi:hypothetical protein